MQRSAGIIALLVLACLEASAQSLDAPASVKAGGTFNVNWSGTDAARDYVEIAERGAPRGPYISYHYCPADERWAACN